MRFRYRRKAKVNTGGKRMFAARRINVGRADKADACSSLHLTGTAALDYLSAARMIGKRSELQLDLMTGTLGQFSTRAFSTHPA